MSASPLIQPAGQPPQTAPKAARQPFRLSRYFLAVSVIGFAVVLVLVLALSSDSAQRTLIRQEADQSQALGRSIINAIWPRYVSLVQRANSLPPGKLVDEIENVQLRQEIYRLARSLNIVKIRIFTLDGLIIFSNWDKEIGVRRTDDEALRRAAAGKPSWTLAEKPKFEAIDGTVRNRHIIEAYLPVDHPESGERQGVIELYTDVSAELAEMRGDQFRMAAAVALCMLALYTFLMLSVRRAERIMNEQQHALAQSESRARLLARVVEQSRDSIITRDLEGVVTTWNNGAETIFGWSTEEAVGRSMRRLMLSESSEADWQAWLKRLRAGDTFSIRGWRPTKSRGRVHIVGTSGPLTDEDGRLIGDISVAHDTTWLVRTQDELRRAKETAEAATRAKSEFLANMSHEIRTPMNGIIGMTNLALATPLNDEQRDYLTTVKSSADALLRIINDILDLSKIDAGKLVIETVPFGLRESLQQTMRTLAVRAHEKGLELIWSVDPEVPDALAGDPLRIRQILLNLVGNAIKFTTAGEIEVQVRLEDVRAEEVQLRFRVRDTGVGIPADKIGTIFNEFEQADSSITRQFGGTGLGLSISRRLVRMMRGDLSVDSTPGSGSVFQFSLCLGVRSGRLHAAGIHEGVPAELFAGQPVLVVDDNARCRSILTAWLKAWGTQPVVCESAAAARTALANAAATGQGFRLALVDGTLPEGAGFALGTELAAAGGTVIMLADTTQAIEAARARESAGLQCVVKPVTQSNLHDAIVTALDAAGAALPRPAFAPAAGAALTPMARALDVLLVEDNAVNRKLAQRLLEKLGHRVAEAHDGAAALTMTAEHDYDVILMDMQMPVMDGLEATRRIRTRGGRHVPIIALTANAMSGDRERCFAAGMDDYVSKPIETAALVAALERTTGGATATATAAAPTVPPAAATAATAGAGPAYDRAAALARAAGDAELLAQIVDIYVAETPALLAEVEAALAAEERERAFRAAHTLKGSSANLSAQNASEAARRVELAARAGDFAAAREGLPALQAAIAALLAQLASECTEPANDSLEAAA